MPNLPQYCSARPFAGVTRPGMFRAAQKDSYRPVKLVWGPVSRGPAGCTACPAAGFFLAIVFGQRQGPQRLVVGRRAQVRLVFVAPAVEMTAFAAGGLFIHHRGEGQGHRHGPAAHNAAVAAVAQVELRRHRRRQIRGRSCFFLLGESGPFRASSVRASRQYSAFHAAKPAPFGGGLSKFLPQYYGDQWAP